MQSYIELLTVKTHTRFMANIAQSFSTPTHTSHKKVKQSRARHVPIHYLNEQDTLGKDAVDSQASGAPSLRLNKLRHNLD